MLTRPLTPRPCAAFLSKVACVATVLLTGCATGVGHDWTTAWVSSYGNWPAGRAPGSYVFERLPSQQMAEQAITGAPPTPVLNARGQVQHDQSRASLLPIEQLAQAALSRQGFFPAPVGSTPSVLVQISQRTERTVQPNPLHMGWELSYGSAYSKRHRHRRNSGLSLAIAASSGFDPDEDDGPWYATTQRRSSPYRVRSARELSVVLRDAASHQALYEARVREPEASDDNPALIEALFNAALARFPQAQPQPQRLLVSDEPLPALPSQ